MLTLYFLGKLNEFSNVFSVDYFHKNIDEYYKWLGVEVNKQEIFATDIYHYALKGEYAEIVRKAVEEMRRTKKT